MSVAAVNLAVPRAGLDLRPTPVEMHRIAGRDVLVKRDDLISARYGGNKARALEFLLAPPPRRVLTFSTLSAYHAYATAVHAGSLGAKVACVLLRQGSRGPEAAALAGLGARVREARTVAGVVLAAAWLWRPGTRVILPGGMGARGALGYLEAALSLEPLPERIYLPLGSGTTTAGLLAGLALRGAATEVVAVRIVASALNGPRALRRRARRALALLRGYDPTLPEADPDRVPLRVIAADGEYGEATPAALAARDAAPDLPLETTYSAKALAALLAEDLPGAMFLLTWAGPLS